MTTSSTCSRPSGQMADSSTGPRSPAASKTSSISARAVSRFELSKSACSRIRMVPSRSSAPASVRRRRWPPETRDPSSLMSVSRRSGSQLAQSASCARLERSAQLVIRPRLAPRDCEVRANRRVPDAAASWPASAKEERECPPAGAPARVAVPRSSPLPLRCIQKAQEQVDDRGCWSARADERDPPARLEPQIESTAAPFLPSTVRSHTLQGDDG